MINILFSGINKKIGFDKNQQQCLKKYIKNDKNIVFVASVFSDYEKSQYNFDRFTNYFKKIDINFLSTNLIDGRKTVEETKELIKNSDYVFLLGGSPELQMKSLIEYDLCNIINEKDVVIGVSAGSMNQTNRVLYKDDFDNYILKDYKGLNYVDIVFFPHFDFNDNEIYEEVKELSYIDVITLLPNESFIVFDKEIKYYGKHYIIKNGEIG